MEQNKVVDFRMTPIQLAYLTECLHEALYRRLRWMTDPEMHEWRERQDLYSLQIALQDILNLYRGIRHAHIYSDEEIPEYFLGITEIPLVVHDLLDKALTAEEWNEVPYHGHRSYCTTCRALQSA